MASDALVRQLTLHLPHRPLILTLAQFGYVAFSQSDYPTVRITFASMVSTPRITMSSPSPEVACVAMTSLLGNRPKPLWFVLKEFGVYREKHGTTLIFPSYAVPLSMDRRRRQYDDSPDYRRKHGLFNNQGKLRLPFICCDPVTICICIRYIQI